MDSRNQEEIIDSLRRIADALELIDVRIGWFQRFFQALHPDVIVPPTFDTEAEHGD